MINGKIMLNIKTPKITCIIPAYNVDLYIQRAIDCAVKQTLSDIEIIIVNDGSTDSTLDIIKNNQQLDPRIKLINQSNQGLSQSRNNAMKQATGEYIHFFDADDELELNAYEILYNKSIQDKSDVIIFNYKKCVANNQYISKSRNLSDSTIYSSIGDKQLVVHSGVTAWNKLFQRSFLQSYNIEFPKGLLYEDIPFFWHTIILATNISFVNAYLYIYHVRANSIMTNGFNIDKAKHIIQSMELTKDILIKYNVWDSYKALYSIKTLKTMLSFLNLFKKQDNQRKIFFQLASKSLFYINLDDPIYKISPFKKIKYNLLLKNKYNLYKFFFIWMKLKK